MICLPLPPSHSKKSLLIWIKVRFSENQKTVEKVDNFRTQVFILNSQWNIKPKS